MRALIVFSLISLLYFPIRSQSWDSLQKVTDPVMSAADLFGNDVAIFENYAVIGSKNEDYDSVGQNPLGNAGAAFIYKRSSAGKWKLQQKITAADREAGDSFGCSVGIWGDYLVVGALGEDHDPNGINVFPGAGSAYVFKRDSTGTWHQHQKIVAWDRDSLDTFAYSVAISEEYIVVGATGERHDQLGQNPMVHAGSAYVFKKDGLGYWVSVSKLISSDRNANDWFGIDVSVDRNTAVIGAYYEDEDSVGLNFIDAAGSAYIFTPDSNGTWQQRQKIAAFDRQFVGAFFGIAVDVFDDLIAVGAHKDAKTATGQNGMPCSGSVYIFRRDSLDTWYLQQKIKHLDQDNCDFFGRSVEINRRFVLVGATQEDHDLNAANYIEDAGSAYIFSNFTGSWLQEQKIIAGDRHQEDYFGSSVAMDSSGYHIAISAPEQDYDSIGNYGNFNAGAVYIYNNCHNSGTAGVLVTNACNNYNSPSGHYQWTSSGSYTDTLVNCLGCDSIVFVNLTVYKYDTTVNEVYLPNQNVIVLMAADTNAVYQWLDCNNGYSPIAGATSQTFIPPANGSYALQVSVGTCTDTSFCHGITGVGMPDTESEQLIRVYPNPSGADFLIQLSGDEGPYTIRVMDVNGKLVIHDNLPGPGKINLSTPVPGIYILQVITDDGRELSEKLVRY